jgi:hypothetical protein
LLHERREAQEYNQELQQDLESLRLKAEQERVAQESIYAGSKIERTARSTALGRRVEL